MKTVINAKSARNAVKFVSAVTRGAKLPVLGELHCYSNGHFEITGTDLDNTLIARIESRTQIEGKSLVNGRALADACAGNNDLEIEATEKDVTLRNGTAARTIPRFDLGEFPQSPNIPADAQRFTVNFSAFRTALQSVSIAMSKDHSRYILQGVQVEFSNSACKIVATDGRRLHSAEIGAVGNAELVGQNEAAIAHAAALVTAAQGVKQTEAANVQLILAQRAAVVLIQAETVKHLLKMPIAKGDESAALTIVRWGIKSADKQVAEVDSIDHHLRLECGDYVIQARQIDGRYPNYRLVIPSKFTHGIWLNVDAFRAAVKQAATASQESNPSVRLEFGMDQLTVTGGNDANGRASAVMGIYYATAPDPVLFQSFAIAFNPDYLLDICEAAKGSDEMILEYCDELSPGKFRTPSAREMVLMPMRLS